MNLEDLNAYLLEEVAGADLMSVRARELLMSGGKRIRARVTLLLASHWGIESKLTLPWAGANELLHNASLVHDDIQDRDLWRRGQPTMWSRYGLDVAVSVGDFLLMKPFLMVGAMNTSAEKRLQLQQMMAETVASMARAQIDERLLIGELEREDIADRYAQVVRGKTSALFELPVRGLAALADLNEAQSQGWCEALRVLGVYFQVVDDLKDVMGLKDKPLRGADLGEGKVTAPIVRYVELQPSQIEDVRSFLSSPSEERSQRGSEWLQRLEDSGAVSETRRWAKHLWSEFERSIPTGDVQIKSRLDEWIGVQNVRTV